MKKLVTTIALLLCASAGHAEDCPWAGGTFKGDDNQVTVEFTVNSDCTMVAFQSTGSAGWQGQDVPEDFAMAPGKHGWVSEMSEITTTFLTKGHIVDFNGPGVTKTLHVSPVK